MTESKDQVIAVLGGTGNEGPGLALRWASAGFRMVIGSRSLEKAQAAAQDINEKLGISTVSGLKNEDACEQADIAVLTVNQAAHQAALESIKGHLDGKILIDATARVDYRDPKPPAGKSAARIAQDILGPDVRVAAAFQNVPAHALGKNLTGSIGIDVLVCADDTATAEVVTDLIEEIGMQGFFAGNLDNAIVAEGLTALIISMNKHYKSRTGAIRITGIEK